MLSIDLQPLSDFAKSAGFGGDYLLILRFFVSIQSSREASFEVRGEVSRQRGEWVEREGRGR
jgi:hypothetical protein